jgi:nicotinamide riboside transporter PnuC
MGELTDLIASLSGKLGRWLNIKKNRWCFAIWTACLIYWTIRNYQMGLIVQTGSTAISACINIYGFYKWRKHES